MPAGRISRPKSHETLGPRGRCSVEHERVAAGVDWSRLGAKQAVFGNAGVPVPPPNGGGSTIAIAKIPCKLSGTFSAAVALSISGATAGDTITCTVSAVYGNTLGITAASFFGPYLGSGLPGIAGTYGAAVSTAAGGINVTGSGEGAVTLYTTGAQVLGTAQTTFEFSWSSIIQNAANTNVLTPFPTGVDVALQLSLTATHSSAYTYNALSIALQELPNG